MRVGASLLLGGLFGLIGAIVQTLTVVVGGVSVPVGAALGLVSSVFIARATAWWVGSRLGGALFGVGWLASTLAMGSARAGGELILNSGTRQLAYLILGTICLSACAGFPLLPSEMSEEPSVSGVG